MRSTDLLCSASIKACCVMSCFLTFSDQRSSWGSRGIDDKYQSYAWYADARGFLFSCIIVAVKCCQMISLALSLLNNPLHSICHRCGNSSPAKERLKLVKFQFFTVLKRTWGEHLTFFFYLFTKK